MTTLTDHLAQKRDAHAGLEAEAAEPGVTPRPLTARVTAEGRSGVRRIRIRDFQILDLIRRPQEIGGEILLRHPGATSAVAVETAPATAGGVAS